MLRVQNRQTGAPSDVLRGESFFSLYTRPDLSRVWALGPKSSLFSPHSFSFLPGYLFAPLLDPPRFGGYRPNAFFFDIFVFSFFETVFPSCPSSCPRSMTPTVPVPKRGHLMVAPLFPCSIVFLSLDADLHWHAAILSSLFCLSWTFF